MAYGVIMLYHLHMPSYILRTFTEYPIVEVLKDNWRNTYVLCQLKRFFYKVFSNPFQKLFNIGTNLGI